MAVIDAIFSPAPTTGTHVAGLAATTASAEQTPGHNTLIMFSATGAVTVRLGTTGSVTSPTATTGGFDFYLPGGAVLVFEMGRAFDSFKVFNTTSAAIDFFWSQLAK